MAEERERERMYKEQLKELHVSEPKSIDVDILEMIQSAVRNWKLLDDAEKNLNESLHAIRSKLENVAGMTTEQARAFLFGGNPEAKHNGSNV